MPHVRLYVDGLRLSVRGALASWGRPRGLNTDGGAAGTSRRRDRVQVPWAEHPWDGRACQLPLRAVPALCIRRPGEHGITKRTERGWEAQSPASDSEHPTWWVTSWKTLGSPWWSPTSVSPGVAHSPRMQSSLVAVSCQQ